jgi:chromosome segregation ATPase
MLTTRSNKTVIPVLIVPAQRQVADPGQTMRQAIDVVRKTYEDLQARAIELQKTIRREERAVVEWRRKIREAEEQLTRWRPVLTDAEQRLDLARREFSSLAEQTRESAEIVRGADAPPIGTLTNGDSRTHRVA